MAFSLQCALMCPFSWHTKQVAWGRAPSLCFGLGHTRSACFEEPQLKQMPILDFSATTAAVNGTT